MSNTTEKVTKTNRHYGEGSVYQRKDGRWVAKYRDEEMAKPQYLYGSTEAEVRRKLMRRAFSTPSLSFHGPSPAVRFMIRFRSSIRNTSPAPLTALAAMSDSLSESISARTTPLVRPVALSIKGIPMDT